MRAQGLDAAAVVEDVTLVGTADEELLTHATRHQRVLVTANVADFAALATDWKAAGRKHAGLVYLTSRAFAQDRSLVGAVVSALAALDRAGGLPGPDTENILASKVTSVEDDQHRPGPSRRLLRIAPATVWA